LEKKMKFSSVFSGLLVAAASTLATHAGVVWSGPINVEVTQASPYTMTITEDGSTYSWRIENSSAVSPILGLIIHNSSFTPMSNSTGVAASQGAPWVAVRFVMGSSIDGGSFFSIYPTGGSSNETVTLRNTFPPQVGNFSSFEANQHAGFSFGGPSGTAFYGWLSLTIEAERLVVNSFAYTNGPIGAGMNIPAPGAIALLGLVGLVGGRRRA
jgi:hypothetical protein